MPLGDFAVVEHDERFADAVHGTGIIGGCGNIA